MKRSWLPLLVAALFAATACSNTNGPQGPDPGATPECLFADSLETLPIGGNALVVEQPTNPGKNVIFFQAVLTDGEGNVAELPDVVSVTLYEGFGAFRNGYTTGSFDLAAESEALNCGLCVSVFADVQGNGQATQSYFASGGEVTITALDPTPGSGSLVASISNLTLTNIVPEGDGESSQAVTNEACSSTVAAMNLELSIQDGSASAEQAQQQ